MGNIKPAAEMARTLADSELAFIERPSSRRKFNSITAIFASHLY
jgi:hypothetical protein